MFEFKANSDGMMNSANQYQLITRLGISAISHDGLRLALTHRSYCAEHEGVNSNERLEFLGDSVLGAIVGRFIFEEFAEFEEGELTKLRASVVSAQNLSKVAREIGLGQSIILGKGEEASGGREKNSILADALEAVFGAIYLELGFGEAERVILMLMKPHIETYSKGPGFFDFKSRLQELLAQLSMGPPVYEVTWNGPDHARVFHATVKVDLKVLGIGSGSSKKMAEQFAAEDTLRLLESNGGMMSIPNLD